MRLTVWVILGFLMLLTVGLVLGAAKLEQQQLRNRWIHPPDDDDGVSILEDEENAEH